MAKIAALAVLASSKSGIQVHHAFLYLATSILQFQMAALLPQKLPSVVIDSEFNAVPADALSTS
jgi:hypothetical protein